MAPQVPTPQGWNHAMLAPKLAWKMVDIVCWILVLCQLFIDPCYMFLPVLEAIEFLSKTMGGTTHPWIVRVSVLSRPYIVKLFTERQMEQSQSVAKEVFGSFLAREFDLPVPAPALIRFTEEFRQGLGKEQQAELATKHQGSKFGCEFNIGMELLKPMYFESMQKDYDWGSVFAFDNLMRNIDRGGPRNKPNLLFRDTEFLLIDHELILPFANSPGNYNILNEISGSIDNWSYQYKDHLFYRSLKALSAQKKSTIFDTFIYYLEMLNPDKLDTIARQLEEENLPIGDFELLKAYLYKVKAEARWFHHLLNTMIA
jgi:hypothetical protein